jgi:hypothetical protein
VARPNRRQKGDRQSILRRHGWYPLDQVFLPSDAAVAAALEEDQPRSAVDFGDLRADRGAQIAVSIQRALDPRALKARTADIYRCST